MTLTSDQLVAKYIEYRDFLEAKTKEFNEAMKPYQDAMVLIQNTMQQRMNDAGETSVKTAAGTAYKSSTLSVKVADRQTFYDYIFADPATSRQMAEVFFTANIAKDAVKEFLDQHHFNPPGVSTETITKVLFRRA